jgi:RimJ/RimL family protein N-acetyltransferase
MQSPDLRPVWLRGDRVYLRAMLKEDAERGSAWLDPTFPLNAPRAERTLEEEHGAGSWERPRRRLAIARLDGDEVVGSLVLLTRDGFRTGRLAFTMAPWLPDADAVRAEALTLAIRWLRDEMEMMVLALELAADQAETIAAAEAIGMVPGARLREWYATPAGRVDCVEYQALNPRWEVRDA